MAKQTIGIGSTANDGTGDTLRDAFDKANDNFNELYAEILGTGVQTISTPGTYVLSGTVSSLSVTADNVHVIGNGHVVTKMLSSGEGCSFLGVVFGNPAATNPGPSAPASTGLESLSDYVAWSEKPGKFVGCRFIGDGPTGTTVGLFLGKNGNSYGSTTLADVTQDARCVIGCRFINCGVGLLLHTFMEYYTVAGCNFSYNGTGVCVFAGNTTLAANTIVYNREGVRWTYPKTSGSRSYSWTGQFDTPTLYANAASANAFHGRLADCLVNHNTFGLITFETIVSDPKIYGLRTISCEFQANGTADVYASHIERLELHHCYCRGVVSPVLSSAAIYAYGTEIGTVTPVSGGVLYRDAVQELSADPSNPPEGHHTIWQSDGTGAGDDGDILVKVTAGGVTKTATLVDFSAVV